MHKHLTNALFSVVITYASFDFFTISAQANRKFNYKSNTFFNNYIFSKNTNTQFKNEISLNNFKDISFKELQELNKIKKEHSIGKSDPFSMDEEFSIRKNIKLVSLLGIVSDGLDNYALIKYKEKLGNLSIGAVGGETTNLLPAKVKLIGIIVNNSEIIVEFNNEKYTISMY